MLGLYTSVILISSYFQVCYLQYSTRWRHPVSTQQEEQQEKIRIAIWLVLQPWSWCVWKLAHFLCKIAPILWKGEIRFRPQLNRKKKKKAWGFVFQILFQLSFQNQRFSMGVIGKQNVPFYWTCKYSQILNPTWKEFPWDSYFDVLSIQSISGRQKSILSISLKVCLCRLKKLYKRWLVQSMEQLFSLFLAVPMGS